MSNRSGFIPPHYDRVRKLTERLQSIQCSFDADKVTRAELLDKKFFALEEQVAEFHQQTTLKLNDLRERVVILQKGLEEDKLEKSDDMDTKVKFLETVENRVHSAIDQDLTLRRDVEMRVLKALDERSSSFRSELLKESKAKADGVDTLRAALTSGIGKLQEGLKAAEGDITALREDVVVKVEEDSNSLTGDVATERKTREDTEEAMLAMLKDVVGRIKGDLEQERKSRESTEESLLGLLEDACGKLKALTEG